MERLAPQAALLLDEWYSRCRAAEAHRARERDAAVVLQACCRGALQRRELARLGCARAWGAAERGRERRPPAGWRPHASAPCLPARLRRRVAVTIQRCWRGHLGRRRFAAALAARNAQLRQVRSLRAPACASLSAEH